MINDLILFFVLGISAIVLAYFYVGYWALEIRKSLAVRMYRNQALSILFVALAAAYWFFGFTNSDLLIVPSPPGWGTVTTIFLLSSSFLYWIDTSTLTTRRADPLLRNTLHWSQVRYAVWGLNFASFAASLFLFLTVPNYDIYSNELIIIPFLIATISGLILLPIAARRSKNVTLRSHLRWFGLFFVPLIFSFPLGVLPLPGLATVTVLTADSLLGAYCLYRSVRSLVPLNRISLDAETK
jgi:hypothetical protein